MYNVALENQLILKDIKNAMADYVSLQADIDESKVKAAALVAQNVDIKKIIGAENVNRCIGQTSESSVEDKNLLALIIPPLCYYTYFRLLVLFPGVYTDGGYVIDGEAEEAAVIKKLANTHSAIAETFMQDVVDFLEDENPDDENVDDAKLNASVRVFGGEENRASN